MNSATKFLPLSEEHSWPFFAVTLDPSNEPFGV